MNYVSFHKYLAEDHSTTKGGGWYYFDSETKKLYLYGSSEEFGACTKEDLRKAVNEGPLPFELKDAKIYFIATDRLRTALEKSGADTRIK